MEGENSHIPIHFVNCFNQIRSLIKQIKDYGVGEEDLFNEDDLMQRANIPRVCKCLKEIAIIVSISEEMNTPIRPSTTAGPERDCPRPVTLPILC